MYFFLNNFSLVFGLVTRFFLNFFRKILPLFRRLNILPTEAEVSCHVVVSTVPTNNPFYKKVSNNGFVEIAPVTPSARPYGKFYLPDTYSNLSYDLYLVCAPAIAADTLAPASQRLKTKMQVVLEYTDEKGTSKTKTLKSTIESQADIMDTLLIASDLILPTCSYGLETPKSAIKVTSVASNSEANQRKTHTKTLRIDCLILKPHEEN